MDGVPEQVTLHFAKNNSSAVCVVFPTLRHGLIRKVMFLSGGILVNGIVICY